VGPATAADVKLGSGLDLARAARRIGVSADAVAGPAAATALALATAAERESAPDRALAELGEATALIAPARERARQIIDGVAGADRIALVTAGIVGVALPGVPTTGPMILALACFARSSAILARDEHGRPAGRSELLGL
jgi:hypothetical protein